MATHRTDPGALSAGVLFLTVAVLYFGSALAWWEPIPPSYVGTAFAVCYFLVLRAHGRRGRRDRYYK